MHQINHILEHIRSVYTLSTERFSQDFIEKLTAKSGKPQSEIKTLVDYIILIRQKAVVSEDELIKLNTLVENFKNTH